MTSLRFIAPPDCRDSSVVGGKGASLVEMVQAGFPVPPFFCIRSELFRALCASCRLPETFESAAAETGEGSLLPRLAEWRDQLIAARFPNGFDRELDDALTSLGRGPVAVRSSGLAEDTVGASYAGLYQTFLDVSGTKAVEEAIRQALGSLFTERVWRYAGRAGASGALGMSIVVQRMVAAKTSGVLFTLNPMTGCEQEQLVEAVAGLAEKLVSGQVTADRYVISNGDGSILRVEPAEAPTKGDDASPLLSKESAAELSRLGSAVAEHFGRPMDIEWAADPSGIKLLQARPITAITFPAGIGEWTTADFKDGGVSSDVCSPFMWSLYELAFNSSMPAYLKQVGLLRKDQGIVWSRMFFARPYWNLRAAKRVLEPLPGYNERSFDEDLGIAVHYQGDGKTTPFTVGAILRAIPILISLKLGYRRRLSENRRFQHSFGKMIAPYERDQSALAGMTATEFRTLYGNLIEQTYFQSETSYFTTIYNTSNSKLDFSSAFKRADTAVGGDLSYVKLVLGLRNLSHLRPMQAMHELAGELRRAGGEVTMEVASRFARDHPHHSRKELDIRVPRWRDDVPFVKQLLEDACHNYDATQSPEARSDHGHRIYQAERDRALRALRFRPFARRSFRNGLALVRSFAWWREEMRDYSSRIYDLVRTFTLEAARRLAKEHLLDCEDDIFYLRYQEVLAAMDGDLDAKETRTRARLGRRMLRSFRNFPIPDEIREASLSTATVATRKGDLLQGTGCSPGVATGTARLLGDISERERLAKGEILVARFTDPGWTPLFASLGGVITETGGLLSHAALVSREYGIPAILAVKDATRIIQDGDRITIDGLRGTIAIHREEPC